MATREVSPITKTVFDLDSFEDVLLVKTPPPMQEVSSIEELQARLGHDSKKLLKVINDGLEDEYRKQFEADETQVWHTFDEEGEPNGEFAGSIADSKAVNKLRNTLAVSVFGYSKDLDKTAKKAAKDAAMEMIKNTPAIKAGLQKSAAKK